MGFSLELNVSALTVFLQGLVSFFSPCVLPLIPLYMGYLSGGTGKRGEDGRMYYQRGRVMLNTLFFVLGVSFAFLLLGLGMTAVGQFFSSRQIWFARIGGILVFGFGLYQLGVFGTSKMLEKEYRLPFRLDVMAMSPVTALVLGFTFSFAWTPCVGPALASVLIMAASAATQAAGVMLIGVYTLGFVLPFLAVGLFTASLLEFFKRHNQVVKYTVKIGGVLMLIMGVMMFTGKMNSITGYLSQLSNSGQQESLDEDLDERASEAEGKEASEAADSGEVETDGKNAGETAGGAAAVAVKDSEGVAGATDKEVKSSDKEAGAAGKDAKDSSQPAGASESETENVEQTAAETDAQDSEEQLPPAIDFTLTDQYGNAHTLSDYKGKTVFLNFWATWCPPCRAEMPDIQKIYDSYRENEDDSLVILGVAGPNQGQEGTQEEIADFLEENGYTYPVVMDTTGEAFAKYGVYALPTTFMIDRDGNVFGYVSGQLSEDIMLSIIEQTMEGKRR
ncbi:MAG: redoxin domain-containing protein [Clostridium sp.]|nr:redoxin domain-containing protein [Clostridium sp.]